MEIVEALKFLKKRGIDTTGGFGLHTPLALLLESYHQERQKSLEVEIYDKKAIRVKDTNIDLQNILECPNK